MDDIERISVLLAGDCPLLRSGFRQVLEGAGVTVVGSVDTAAEAASLLQAAAADVIVVGAVTGHGVADVREIRAAHPEVPVLVLGRSGDTDGVRAALSAGARGYLALEGAADGDLIQAVRSLAGGEMYLSPELAASHASTQGGADRASAAPSARLTERERQVLTLVARGRSNREIAQMLGLSANTIAVHRANLMKTLAVRKTAALVLYAVRHGLVTAD